MATSLDGPTATRLSAHWDGVYSSRDPEELSWFQGDPVVSRRLIRSLAPTGAAILDVGAGESTLVDRLAADGYTDLTLLDVSRVALARVAQRLGTREGVFFEIGDVRGWRAPRRYDLWHDRAVLHFLVDPLDQRRYVDAAEGAVAPSGVLVVGTFADDGPARCSGLEVARHSAAALAELFAPAFNLESSEREVHHTPAGVAQSFTWAVLRRAES